MKTKIIILAMALSLFVTGCDREERDDSRYYPMRALEVIANYNTDNLTDDISYIAQAESDAISTSGRGGQPSFLSGCAQVTTTISGNIWTRVIDFGSVNCALANGNQVRGKITLVFSDDFAAATRTVRYELDNFYHNDRLVQGNQILQRSAVNGHPVTTFNMSFTVTNTAGDVYRRVGQRICEFTSGYNTLALSDNQFSITGSWIMAFSNNTVQVATINTPLMVHWDCAHIMRGTIKFIRDNSSGTALLDYGNGTCDNQAILSVNGNPILIILGAV